MEPIKLGIIGCGIAARELHLPALQKLEDKFQITAVCNHTIEKAKSFAELAGGVPFHQDYNELLNRDDVEAVDIILPIDLNLRVTRDALMAGKHVLVEKPLGASMDDAKEMLELDNKYNLVKMVAENFRYRPGLIRMKALLDQEEIGQPYAVMWNYFGLLEMTNKYAKTKWRINHTYPGGFITDGGVHNIAGLRLLFGDIISGRAFMQSQNPDIGKVDTFSFQFLTESGVNGILNIFISSFGFAENRLIVLGKKASMVLEDNKLLISDDSGVRSEELFENDNGYCEEFLNFFDAIRSNKPVVSTFMEGYKDLETMIRAQESAMEFDGR